MKVRKQYLCTKISLYYYMYFINKYFEYLSNVRFLLLLFNEYIGCIDPLRILLGPRHCLEEYRIYVINNNLFWLVQ